MAGVLLRHSFRSKDQFLRLANSTLLELSKRASNGLIHDPYSAFGVFSHTNAATSVITNHLVTLRHFSSSRVPLFSADKTQKSPINSSNQDILPKNNDTTVSSRQLRHQNLVSFLFSLLKNSTFRRFTATSNQKMLPTFSPNFLTGRMVL